MIKSTKTGILTHLEGTGKSCWLARLYNPVFILGIICVMIHIGLSCVDLLRKNSAKLDQAWDQQFGQQSLN